MSLAQKYIHTIQAARFRYIGGLLALFLAGMTAMRLAAGYVSMVSHGAAIFDLNFGNDVTHINNTLFALGAVGRDVYLYVFLVVDTCYAAIYAVFYTSALMFLLQRIMPRQWSQKYIRWVMLLPLMAAVFDWWENASFAFMIVRFPRSVSSLLAMSTTVATRMKFILVYLSLLIVLGLVVYYTVMRRRTSTQKSN